MLVHFLSVVASPEALGLTLFPPSAVFCRTWTGPAWSPAQSISSVLISIQSLMTENPYHNEPGFEQVRPGGPAGEWNTEFEEP